MSDFIVSARRYRPTKFGELIGQDHVSSTLQKALEANKLAHAFLFCGPRGVGKTSCARILAKVINCEAPVNEFTACDSCNSCKSFNENTSFNIIELDAASNNGVDNIRALNEQVRFQPQQGKYKVFIIDEVHMLSSGAFNAFLKTLEEPPSYAIFILATTEKHKIIPTILSRCQIFDFKRIQIPDIIRQLKYIVEQEGKTADDQALWTIAEKADGAMRDALSIYDRISSSSDTHIHYQDVVQNLNVLDYDYYFRITDAFLAEDLAEIFLTFDKVLELGFDADHFINGLSAHLRDLMVCQDPRTMPLLEVGEELKSRYLEQAAKTTRSFLLSAINLANECDINYKKVKNQRLHVEICLAKIAHIQRRIDHPVVAQVSEKKTPEPNVKIDQPERVVSESENPPVEKKEVHISHEEKGVLIKPIAIKPVKPKAKKTSIPSFGNLDDLVKQVSDEEDEKQKSREKLDADEIHKIFLRYLEKHNLPSLESVYKNSIVEIAGENIQIYVPSPVSRETILQENLLLDSIRKRYLRPDLRINIEVDKERFPDYEEIVSAKPLSQKEKFEKLGESNPLIFDLAKRFDLKPDMD